ncbi:hypothetical protein LJR296_001478 [Cupriavidus necator]|uniref:hypothetical protein n=1 Tax=Cupriavidus necator TaxID=106590 RepID=UPI003ECCBEB8
MAKNSTGASGRHGRNQAVTAQVLAFPGRAPAAVAEQGGQIIIDLRANGTHDARMTGGYAEDLEAAIEALELVWREASKRIHPVALASIAKPNIIDFPARRIA